MLKNYIKIAFRNLYRHRTFSIINILGLAIAITCCLLIYLYVADELSYDRYNQKANRIYRITRDFLSPDGSVNLHLGHLAPPFGPLLKNDFPEFDEVARTLQIRLLTTFQDDTPDPVSLYVDKSYLAEPSLFKIFTMDIIEGDPLKNFDEPLKVIMSEKTAERFFGKRSPLGKRLKIFNSWDVEVTGVFKNFPDQSFWHPEMFVSFSTLNDPKIYGKEALDTRWGNNSFGTYALVKEPFDEKNVVSRFPDFLDNHMGGKTSEKDLPKPSTWTRLYLQKLTEIHLYSHLDSEEETNGSITGVYMTGLIGLFILVIACFNFINLSTARATKRSREVGIRKVTGANKYQLILQFTGESIVIALVAMLIAWFISYFALTWMNEFTGKSLHIFHPVDGRVMIGLILFSILIGILAGIYPAFVMSGFKPVTVMKSQSDSSRSKGNLRKVLVIIQFTLSIILIIATMITYQQLNYLYERDLGYDKNQVIILPYYSELDKNYDAFYHEMTSQSFIRDVTRSSRIPTGRLLDSQGSARIQVGDSVEISDVTIKNIRCDYEFFNTYSIPFVAGRNFSREIKSDDSLAFILNETAVKMMGLSEEEILRHEFEYGGVKGNIVGVVRDFHFESLKEPIVPVVFKPSNDYNRLSIKVSGQDIPQALTYLEKSWNDFLPIFPFEYEFLSERYQKLYLSEQHQGKLFTVFSALAIFIACLGLFGLVTFNTLQRFKEIGIRKVLGASVANILTLLSKETLVLMLVANLLAWPVTWLVMNRWLENFAYRIQMMPGLFILAALLIMIVSLGTISFQTFKAALANPVDSIRNE